MKTDKQKKETGEYSGCDVQYMSCSEDSQRRSFVRCALVMSQVNLKDPLIQHKYEDIRYQSLWQHYMI
jgi:hypothetical protein